MTEPQTEQPPEAQETPESEKSKPEVTTKPRPVDLPESEGWDLQEFDEATQKRFNRVYGQMKHYERVTNELGDINRQLLERLENIETKQTKQEVDSRVNGLTSKIAEAYQAGDVELATRLQNELIDAKVTEKVKPESKTELKPQSNEFQFTEQQKQELLTWAQERDEQGASKRPWADPGHPQHATFLQYGAAILEDPQWRGAQMNEILDQVDKVVGFHLNPNQPRRGNQAAVLSSDPNTRTPRKTERLSRDEEAIARAMGMESDKYLAAKKKWT